MIDGYIAALADYGVERRLIGREDRQFVINRLLEIMELDSFDEEIRPAGTPLAETLDILCDNAAERGVIGAPRAL